MITETYNVPAANLDQLKDRVARLNRRATRLEGISAITLDIAPEANIVQLRVPCEIGNPDNIGGGGDPHKLVPVAHHRVTIVGEPVTEHGWTFVATLHHEGEGETLVATLPGEKIPTAYRWASNQCDHCGAARRRNATFLIRNDEDGGKLYQVGRNCLADFLPRWDRDPRNLARWAEVWGAFWVDVGGAEDPEWGGSFRAEWMLPLEDFLAATSLLMRDGGWLSRGAARDRGEVVATADRVMTYLRDPSEWAGTERERLGQPTDADKARAASVVEWAEESLLSDDESLSDYEHNLSVVVRLGFVRMRHVGLAASMIRAWQRATGASEDGKRPASAHVAEEGSRVRLHGVEVTFTMEMEDRGYGASLLVKMLHDGRNVLTWFASASTAWPQKGDIINLKGTVKRHGEYKGTAESQLTRVVWDLDGADPDRANVEGGRVDFDDLQEEAVL